MQTMLQNNSREQGHLNNPALMRGITAELIGRLVSTIGPRCQSNGTGVNVVPAR